MGTRVALSLAAVLAAALLTQSAPAAADRASASAVTVAWDGAGAFVHNEGHVDPTELGRTLRTNRFRWAVVILHDGLVADPVDVGWIDRFRAAAGPDVALGGWGVLREQPEAEAALAAQLLERYDLGFYVANAELEYKLSGDGPQSPERFGRSRRFVDAFRARLPQLPAAVSSYCRADQQDLDWAAWRDAGFDFLPQAYVNDFGAGFSPGACAAGAEGHFPLARVHPTLGTYPSAYRVTAEQYVTMLATSPTTGFSLYLAEVDMSPAKWQAYGRAASAEAGVARWPAADPRPVVPTAGIVPAPALTLYTQSTVTVGTDRALTLHFFSSRAGTLRVVAGGAPLRSVAIRAGQNLVRLRLPARRARATQARPTRLELTTVSPTGETGRTLVLRLRYAGR
ncbi:MAG TPA: hypothetical protein VLB86_04410 [Gaiellaceae bacterium]|nr:hypothetical protein [Gaiellaceae bacterium]